MLRSIHARLVVMYLCLILVAMELTGVYLLRSLERYYVENFAQQLNSQAQLLSGLLARSLQGEPDTENVRKLAAEFDATGSIALTVLDAAGVVIGASRGFEHTVGNKLEADEITHALGGSRGESLRVDTEDGRRYIYLALPVRAGGEVAGVLYLRGSLEGTYEVLRQVRLFLLSATGIALAVTAGVGFLLARTITGPIQALTSKAAEMARGNLAQPIEVRSRDEIGHLAAMFNHLGRRLKETLDEISGEKNRMETILTYMADGLVALDAQGRIIALNPAAARMLQIAPEQAVGRRPGELWPELPLQALVEQARHMNQPVVEDVALTGPVSAVLRSHCTPLYGEGEQVAGTVIVLHDITEQEKLEQLRREFVANVSHELKTPLTTVKSYVETLLDGVGDDAAVRNRFLKVVDSETDRMVRLVKDLLHLSQLDQGSLAWEMAPQEVAPLIEETLGRLSLQLKGKRLQVHRRFSDALPLIMADRDKLQQVLLNILTNAAEFTPAGGEVFIEARTQGEMVVITVRDTGVGIPAEDVPHIFERFYRVDKARSRMLGGTGLGLAIARQIVEAHGGSIHLKSTPGRGTEVAFTVPAVRTAALPGVKS